MALNKKTVELLIGLLDGREMGWDTKAKAIIVRDVYGDTASFVRWHLYQWSDHQKEAKP